MKKCPQLPSLVPTKTNPLRPLRQRVNLPSLHKLRNRSSPNPSLLSSGNSRHALPHRQGALLPSPTRRSRGEVNLMQLFGSGSWTPTFANELQQEYAVQAIHFASQFYVKFTFVGSQQRAIKLKSYQLLDSDLSNTQNTVNHGPEFISWATCDLFVRRSTTIQSTQKGSLTLSSQIQKVYLPTKIIKYILPLQNIY